jgi:hypothetical protein
MPDSPEHRPDIYWTEAQYIHFVIRLPLNHWSEAPFYLVCPWLYVMWEAQQDPIRILGVSETESWKQTMDLNTP